MKRKLRKKLPLLFSVVSKVKQYLQLLKVYKRIESYSIKIESERNSKNSYVINAVRSYIPIQIYFELILAIKLYEKGHKVKVLIDDGVLLHHDTITKQDSKLIKFLDNWLAKECNRIIRNMDNLKDIVVFYSDLQSCSIKLNLGCVDNKEFVEASLVRYYLSASDITILERENDYKTFEEIFTKNAELSSIISSKAIDKYKPSSIISSHGIYSSWGAFCHTAKDRGVAYTTYGSDGFNVDAYNFSNNDIAASKNIRPYFNHSLKGSIDKHLNNAKNIMDERLKGLSRDTYSVKEKYESIYTRRIETAKRNGIQIHAVFPNVMWDNATTFKELNTCFNSPVEWLYFLVDEYMKSDEALLVIRVHPAESKTMTVRLGVEELLVKKYGDKIYNSNSVLVIPSHEAISSYSLFESIDLGLVYNGTIALELMYMGVPVLAASKAAYSGCGFTSDAYDISSFKALLGSSNNIADTLEMNREKLLLFISIYFSYHGVPLKHLSRKYYLEPNFDCTFSETIQDENLEYVVSCIEGRSEYYQDWKLKYE